MRLLLGNIFSLLSAIFFAVSAFSSKKEKLTALQATDSVFNAISQIILGGYTGAITNIVAIIRNISLCKYKITWKNGWFFVLASASGLIFTQTWIDILPPIASIIYTIALISIQDIQKLRISICINVLLWAIYSFTIQAYPTFLISVITLVTTIISIIINKKRP